MADIKSTDPSEWLLPDQLLKLHRLKVKKRALQARMNKKNAENTPLINNQDANTSVTPTLKRKNPFIKSDVEKKAKSIDVSEVNVSQDSTLFELLQIKSNSINEQSNSKIPVSFSDVLAKMSVNENITEVNTPQGEKYIPINWALSSKMRVMSLQPFPWSGTCKTSEQASGTSAFVRCLDIGGNKSTIDTSPNARFHQCCLIWQHPSLPWLQLFPRSGNSGSTNSGINTSEMRTALYRDWCDSFKSLFYLLRAKQCPYFYFCANSFTILFRAAGICGVPVIHALITPTTQGFRQSLKQEDVEFSMPLKPHKKRHSGTDSGFDSNTGSTLEENNEDEDDEEDDEQWLRDMGMNEKQIQQIIKSKERKQFQKGSEDESVKQSLVFVEGIEVQGLFNFLINYKSAICTYGSFAGIPPTLLSPVAFHGATLKPIKTNISIVRYENEKYYSMELKGPLLPHVLPSLCNLMKSSHMDQFTMSCAHISSTVPFTTAKHGKVQETVNQEENIPQVVFGQEGLSDCGFNQELLEHFCTSDPNCIEAIESIKYSDGLYIWE